MTTEGRIFLDLRHQIEVRRRTPQLSAAAPLRVVEGLEPAVFAFVREHPLGPLSAVFGFEDVPTAIDPALLPAAPSGMIVDLLDGSRHLATGPIVIPPRGVRWLVDAGGDA